MRGPVRFSGVVNPTVRFGFIFMSYDAVRSGILCPTVRFGAVVRYRKTYRAVRCAFQAGKYAAVG